MGGGANDVSNAIKDTETDDSCYDYVYVSLGGTDQLEAGCEESNLDNVQKSVTSALNKVRYGVNALMFAMTLPLPQVFN